MTDREIPYHVVLDGVEPCAAGLRPVHVDGTMRGPSSVAVREELFCRATEAGVTVDRLVVEPQPEGPDA